MPLSRLENFLKNVEGNILYVNPTDLDATDSIENQGNSLTKPFKTIQRALLEASRFSYQIGQNNDRFDRTTILLYPGTHEIDNRPGYNVTDLGGVAVYRDRNGNSQTLNQLTDDSNYNIDDSANELYKYNSVEGGVVVPRGVSIVGLDLRKTKVRPKFVPDPTDDAILRSAIFRVTGGCYFWQFSIFDGDPNNSVYKDYTANRFSPNFSHHKLTVFEYADGVNGVGIGTSTSNTDLQMYFHKIQRAYGDSSGRAIGDYPSTVDMQPKLPEYQIVGPVVQDNVGISSIRAGAGSKTNTSTTVTVDCEVSHGLVVDSPVRISGVNTYPNIYNGNFVVSGVSSDRIFTYQASSAPLDGLPSLDGDEVVIADTDSVTGASPYIFNCSIRSAFGMCGLHADGSKATGFKSMVVAQYTGIGLQKDNNAFLLYNATTGQYDTNATVADSAKPLYLNSSAVYRPSYENYHIKTSNDAFIQNVSIFAIGYSQHFLTESGGDQSITNSNSNFGAKALISKGFKDTAFGRDNRGFITHIVPPQNLVKTDTSVEWLSINVGLTTAPVGLGTTAKIFLDGFTDSDVAPPHIFDGYRIGAKNSLASPDLLSVSIAGVGTFSSPIRMINFDGTEGVTGQKEYEVGRTGTASSISSNVITLRSSHKLFAGESVRVISDDGHLPDGIDHNTIYYAVTNQSQNETLDTDQIKLARTENDAVLGGSGNFITINNNQGGLLKIISRVSDKAPGDFGHPIQYDSDNSNWYIRGGISTSENTLWQQITDNQSSIGERTNKTFITRKEDTRSLQDKIYKLRYVIPKESSDARPPIPGYILQESSTVGVTTSTDFTSNIPNVNVQRNVRVLKSIDRDANTGVTTVVTEKPHTFLIGDEILFNNIKSSGNSTGVGNSGYNISRTITGITSSKGFEVSFSENNPGTFIDNVSTRGSGLPTISRKTYKDTFNVYRVDILRAHEYNKQDGVYHLICVDSSISPTVNEFNNERFNQSIENLYPQFDADNFNMDPLHASSFAVNTPVGRVVTNNLKNSITKEFANSFLVGNRIGYAVTGALGSTQGISTIFTNVEHNFNSIISVGIGSSGVNYGAGISTTLYNATLAYSGIETGKGATANIDIDASGGITAVTIVDGGSAYGVGHTLRVTGVQTNTGFVEGWVTINKINNNIGDAIQIVGVGSDRNRYDSNFNGIHTVVSVTPKSVTYNNEINAGIYTATTTGIHTGFFMLAGDSSQVTSISYTNSTTGIVTVTTSKPHGLNVNNVFKIVGVAQTIYNGQFVVNEKVGVNTFTFKFTEPFNTDSYTSGGQVLPVLYGARGGVTEPGNERIGQRHVPFFVGIGTTLGSAGITTTSTTLELSDSSGFYKGDYIQINSEIIRIASDFASDQATVLRGQLGSRSSRHDATSVVKKIRVIPTEKRRYSILRASGHTFEYLGFGPGNYATGLPQKQDRVLTREEQFLSQSKIDNGGSVVYTGMNDAGDFYIGNRRVSSLDGTESTFNIPIPTTTGSDTATDATSGRLDVIFDSVNIRESLIVEGNNNTTVKLNAPTQITEKLTSTSVDGVEVVSLDITGGLAQPRTLTYSPTQPVDAGTEGDVVFNSSPSFGQYLGWVYTQQGWKRFGLISTEVNETQLSVDQIGIGTTSAGRLGDQNGIDVRGQIVGDNHLIVGVATFLGSVSFSDITLSVVNVGVGTFTDRLDSQGDTTLTGITTVTSTKSLDVNTSIDVSSDLLVAGISTLNGNVDIGNATSDTLTITSRIDSDVDPSTDNARDIGSDALRWANVHADNFVGLARSTTNLVLADESTDTTCFPIFATGATGTLPPKTGSNLTFNSSTGTLGATIFSGSGASLTSIPNSATTATATNTGSTIVSRDGSGNFNAGTITATLSGNVTGNVTGNADTATVSSHSTVSAASTDQSYNVTFVSGTSGTRRIEANSNLTYNPSTQVFTNSSDERLKTNIVGITGAVEKVQQLRGVEFDWISSGHHSIGVIAQDVEKVLPELVSKREDGMMGVDYSKLTAVLIEAIKEQQVQISELKSRLDELTK